MISSAERRTRARTLGVQEASIDRDFVLACLLAALAENPDPFVFRGGTALTRVYWIDFRLSEDIDLIATGAVPDLEGLVRHLVGRASQIAGVPMVLAFSPPTGGWSRSIVQADGREVIVDINLHEQVALPPAVGKLVLPYLDLRDRDLSVPTVALPEILGNKWYMVDDRSEPRDLFDVWWGLCREGNSFADLARGHLAKYRFRPVRQVLSKARTQLSDKWEERLAHQVRALPRLDQVLGEVQGSYEAWEQAGQPVSDL